MPKAAPATRADVAANGHIAAFLRQQMKERGWKSVADFNEALGFDRGNAVTFKWLNSKGAPAAGNRAKLAKLFKVPEETFVPRNGAAPAGTTVAPEVRVRAPDVLSFNFTQDGEARIRLDVTLPAARAWKLLRTLEEAGITPSGEGEA